MILNNIQEVFSHWSDTLGNVNDGDTITFNPHNTKSIKKKIFYYNILKSSRGKLQEYVTKNRGFHLKKST